MPRSPAPRLRCPLCSRAPSTMPAGSHAVGAPPPGQVTATPRSPGGPVESVRVNRPLARRITPIGPLDSSGRIRARYNSRPGTAEADHQEGPMESAPRGTRPGPKAAQVTA